MTLRHAPALPLVMLLACAAAFTACSRDPAPPPTDTAADAADDGFIARTTRRALESARKDLAESNISVGGDSSKGLNINGFTVGRTDGRSAGLPKAEISPAGDLLLGGKPVAIDDTQRQLLLAHRANIVAMAETGIAIGIQGAQLGVRAARGAIASALTGTTEEFEKRMEAEGAKMEAEAQKMCTHMPALLASQQALAAALPEFAPYATMDASDVDDCGKDVVVERDDPAAEADAAAGPASN